MESVGPGGPTLCAALLRSTAQAGAPVIVFVPGLTGSSGGWPAPVAVLVYWPERSWQTRQSLALASAGGGAAMSSQP